MDVHDVSSLEQYAFYMRQFQENVARAASRKGETPRDHRPPWILIHAFMERLAASARHLGSSNDDNQLASSQVPAPYAPCKLPAADLKPIPISQMKLETHHRGRRVVVRVLTPPHRMTAVMAIVEDQEGTAVLLQLYHQPVEATVPKGNILQQGDFVLIKEPYFKAAATDGSYSLRADHVSDVIFLDDANDLVPEKWRRRQKESTPCTASREIRLQGNQAVEKKEWATAEKLYSASIEAAQTTEDDQLAHLNRSLANLRLGRPASALLDADHEDKNKDGKPKEKALFRKASALYELRKFETCLEVLQSLEAHFPLSSAAKPMLDRVKQRLREQEIGEYNFQQMYKQARATPPLIDCATYSVPVEVRSSPGRGRGLFTTRKVSAGELLVCEKALGYAHIGKGSLAKVTVLMNMATKRMTMGGQADLLSQLVQKLYHDPEAAQEFGELYHGDHKTVAFSEVDGRPVVDTFLVERVIALTGFGCSRTSREGLGKKTTEVEATFHTCGVWSLVSHINHACIINCHRSFIGDMQIIRATRDLDPGTELFFWYKNPKAFQTYDEAQQQLKPWGFSCGCALCLARKDTTRATINGRKTSCTMLQKVMGHLMNGNARSVHVKKAKKLLNQLEGTYSASERAPGAVRLELWEAYFVLSETLRSNNDCAEAIEMAVRGLEAFGFIITACPPRPSSELQKGPARFQVEQWGLTDEFVVLALVTLFRAYKVLAPEVLVAIKKYVETAYSMIAGEKDTILEVNPELALF